MLAGASMIGVEAVAFFCRAARHGSIFHCVKRTNVDLPPVDHNLSLPATIPASPYSRNAAGIVGSNADVAHIILAANVAQIFDPVVLRIAVDVIDFSSRPAAMENGPANPVRSVVLAKENSVASAMRVNLSECFSPSIPCIPAFCQSAGWHFPVCEPFGAARFPRQFARGRVIIQQLTQLLGRGTWLLSHAMLHSSLWSGVAGRWRDLQPRNYSMKHLFFQWKTGGF